MLAEHQTINGKKLTYRLNGEKELNVMTIQIYGVIWFGGNSEIKIEEYFNSEKDAQTEWERLYNKYEHANCKTEIYAIKNEADNIRPEKRYGASPYIKGFEMGKMIIGNYA